MVWVRGGYCGIRFDEVLPESWVSATRARPAALPEVWKLRSESRVRRI